MHHHHHDHHQRPSVITRHSSSAIHHHRPFIIVWDHNRCHSGSRLKAFCLGLHAAIIIRVIMPPKRPEGVPPPPPEGPPPPKVLASKRVPLETVEVLAWGDAETLCRPCVDCGQTTGCFCDYCQAANRIPSETWAEGQLTPLCHSCDKRHGSCHFCRGVAWSTPPEWK